MADNLLEKKMEALQERKAKEQRLKQAAWQKRMAAYRKRLEEQQKNESADQNSIVILSPALDGMRRLSAPVFFVFTALPFTLMTASCSPGYLTMQGCP